MARRKRPAAAPLEEEPPDWLWQFRWADWGLPVPSAETPVSLPDAVKARQKWRAARDEWLKQRGLVVLGSTRGLSHGEFRRLEREEPHRVLRRPATEGNVRARP